MPEGVEVTATARLHMGFLDLNGTLGRRFGSIGLALDRPCTRISLRRTGTDLVDGAERSRAKKYLDLIVQRLDAQKGHELRTAKAIPAHAGLGSGTQLALAVAAAVRRLHGLPADPRADAALLGRGSRSGIGIGLFAQGGLVVDGGVGEMVLPPPLLVRLAVPEDWRILLVLEPSGEGLSGRRETAAFGALPPMTEADAGRLCRLVLMQALPAAAEDNLAGFGAAIEEIQALVGDYFAPAQGGRLSSPRVAAALSAMRELGAVGIGQSSWGPTGFAFVRGDAAAERVRRIMTPIATGLDIAICRALNRGAAITEI